MSLNSQLESDNEEEDELTHLWALAHQVHTQGAFVSEDSAAFTHAFVGVLKSPPPPSTLNPHPSTLNHQSSPPSPAAFLPKP